jgi:LysM repeat protein
MSEGGMLDWKRQKLKLVKTADYSEIQKPLPKLPNDCKWHQDQDTKEWSIISIPKSELDTIEHTENSVYDNSKNSGITHKVLSTDTIQGICLRYKISPHELRKANHFTGDNLHLAPETLIIPTRTKVIINTGESTDKGVRKELKISHFLQALNQSSKQNLGNKEAVAYLDISDWDVDAAVKMALDDLLYESTVKKS